MNTESLAQEIVKLQAHSAELAEMVQNGIRCEKHVRVMEVGDTVFKVFYPKEREENPIMTVGLARSRTDAGGILMEWHAHRGTEWIFGLEGKFIVESKKRGKLTVAPREGIVLMPGELHQCIAHEYFETMVVLFPGEPAY